MEFLLPIEYRTTEVLAETTREELEFNKSDIENTTPPIYKLVVDPKTKTGESMLDSFSKTYTTDKKFLKDTQKLLSEGRIPQVDSTLVDKVWTLWNETKNEKDFKLKFSYVDWNSFLWLNESETFLFLVSIYNIASPVIALLVPILALIFPFIIIKLEGSDITFSYYFKILLEISESHGISKLFTNLQNATAKKEDYIYVLFSTVCYIFSFYQNFVLCLKFCRNFMKINHDLITIKMYLCETISNMQKVICATERLSTYSSFTEALLKHKIVLQSLFNQFKPITPFSYHVNKLSEVGHIMKVFYTLFENEDNVVSMKYSFGFNGYIDIMKGIEKRIQTGRMNACRYKKSCEFTNLYYAGLMNEPRDKVVLNNVSFKQNIVLTGANASGKTTILKAVLINLIFCQQFGYGCFDSLTMSPYHQFHCYININDTSGRDSLFQSESKKCRNIIDALTNPKRRHFCAFDELFSGTNPKEAVKCGYGYLSYLCQKKDMLDFILTTHYTELCTKLKNEASLFKMAVQHDENDGSYNYSYKMEPGCNTLDGGIEILKQLNFPKEIILNIEKQNS
jgi:MutS domain V